MIGQTLYCGYSYLLGKRALAAHRCGSFLAQTLTSRGNNQSLAAHRCGSFLAQTLTSWSPRPLTGVDPSGPDSHELHTEVGIMFVINVLTKPLITIHYTDIKKNYLFCRVHELPPYNCRNVQSPLYLNTFICDRNVANSSYTPISLLWFSAIRAPIFLNDWSSRHQDGSEFVTSLELLGTIALFRTDAKQQTAILT